MNTDALKSKMEWRLTGTVRGVKIRGTLPEQGNACYYGCGSDSYGYQIGKVADDGLTFEVLNQDGSLRGTAILATNKRFRGAGNYYFVNWEGKPSYYYSRGILYGDIHVTDEKGCGETYLDPSF